MNSQIRDYYNEMKICGMKHKDIIKEIRKIFICNELDNCGCVERTNEDGKYLVKDL